MKDRLIKIDTAHNNEAEIYERVYVGANVSEGSVRESTIQNLLFRYPDTLPISAIDSAYMGIIPVCKELRTPSGFVDALYVNPHGRLVLVEFKLWRNPEARREVIGQILDYAKDLASWDYEDLQREVSLNTGKVLFDLVKNENNVLNENDFVDSVSRYLRRGEFLLLIVGDGISEGVENIVDFVQRHSGLHFNLALVEASLYRDTLNQLFVHPRVLARTEIVQRFTFEGEIGTVIPADLGEADEGGDRNTLSARERQNMRFWEEVLNGFQFSDTSIVVPTDLWPRPPKDSSLHLPVRNASFNGWALSFVAFVHRNHGTIGCYLSVRKNHTREERIFDEIAASVKENNNKNDNGLDQWENDSGRPRIGFWKNCDLTFLAQNEHSGDFVGAVSWMRNHYNNLVSHLNPRLQDLLKDNR
ncbi:MAG: hypothetical protein OXO51_09230 [Gemmatimonadota bacterium]|nr:hypothetical protein [Gemmatimonadota bacterium]